VNIPPHRFFAMVMAEYWFEAQASRRIMVLEK